MIGSFHALTLLVELAVVAGGLLLLHRGREQSAGLIKAAGAVLIAAGLLTAVGTGYGMLRHHHHGGCSDRMGCPYKKGPCLKGPPMHGGWKGHRPMHPGMHMPGKQHMGSAATDSNRNPMRGSMGQ